MAIYCTDYHDDQIIVANFLDPWLKKRRKAPLAASGLGQDRN